MVSNNAGGPYNDAQMQHVRPEHDFRQLQGQDEKASCGHSCECVKPTSCQ